MSGEHVDRINRIASDLSAGIDSTGVDLPECVFDALAELQALARELRAVTA